MGWTLYILGLASDKCEDDTGSSYQGVIREVLGPLAGWVISISMSIYLFGSCVAYLDIIADQVASVADAYGLGESLLASRPLILAVVVVVVLVPLCLLPNISALNYASAIAVLSIVYLEGDVIAHSAGFLQSSSPAKGVTLLELTVGLFKALPILAFALQCHLVYVPVYHSLENKSIGVMNLVSVACYALCLCLYLPTGIMGYLQFGETTCSDIVSQNLPSQPDTDVARGSIALTALLSYPLLHFVARTTLNDVIFGGASFKRDDGRHVHYDKEGEAAEEEEEEEEEEAEQQGGGGRGGDLSLNGFIGTTDIALASPASTVTPDGHPYGVALLEAEKAGEKPAGCAASCNRRAKPRTCGLGARGRYLALTLGFLVATYGVASAVSSLGVVLGVTGSTAAVVQVFLFPAALWLRLSALSTGGGKASWYDGATVAGWVGCAFLVVFGLTMCVVSLVALALSTDPPGCS